MRTPNEMEALTIETVDKLEKSESLLDHVFIVTNHLLQSQSIVMKNFKTEFKEGGIACVYNDKDLVKTDFEIPRELVSLLTDKDRRTNKY
jgi:hypothetical protein